MPRPHARLKRQADLEIKYAEMAATLDAIRHGNVDALMVHTPHGEQVFTLRGADRPYRVMVEQMAEGALTFSRDGTILFCNPRIADLLGVRQKKLLGANIFDYLAADRSIVQRALSGVNGTAARIDLLFKRATDKFPANVSVARLDLDGAETAYCMVVNDMTDRRRLERQVQEVSEREQQRLGQDLHDGLGQSLVGITYMLQNFRAQLRDPAQVTQVQVILDLLRLSQKQTRELAKGFYPVELERNGLRAALLELAAQMTKAFHVQCPLNCAREVNRIDSAAQIHVFRIIQESMRNAVHHGKARIIRVTATCQNGEARIKIQNNGRLFSAPKLRSTLNHSTGMGLKIMEYRAHIIGGSLEILPGKRKGCLVRCTVPLAQ